MRLCYVQVNKQMHLQELQVMKVRQAGGSKCYITVLNTSDSALPEAVLNATATASDGSLYLST